MPHTFGSLVMPPASVPMLNTEVSNGGRVQAREARGMGFVFLFYHLTET